MHVQGGDEGLSAVADALELAPPRTALVPARDLRALTATMQLTEGVPPDLVAQMITKSCVDHPERYPLAFVYGHLGEHDLLRVRTDAEKYLLLAALNLVECVDYVGAQLQAK